MSIQTTRPKSLLASNQRIKDIQLIKNDLNSVSSTSYLANFFNHYGLKYLLIISLLVIYQFIGALIFYVCEAPNDRNLEYLWQLSLAENRTRLIQQILNQIPIQNKNNSLEINNLKKYLNDQFLIYEQNLGARYTDQKMSWTFWNAMLYAQTIYTTIGYGHLYASTQAGRLFTMLYALFGIPFVMSILDNFGKLFTKLLENFWKWIQRIFNEIILKINCFKKKKNKTNSLNNDDDNKTNEELLNSELPLWLAICVVIGWISFCSATFCWFENEWDYFMAFYFFFISLSTIGLGDITPTEPRYLLMLFFYILIGLSLISMLLNLIQSRLERSYEHGGVFCLSSASFNNNINNTTTTIMSSSNISNSDSNTFQKHKGGTKLRRRPGGSSLGIFRGFSNVETGSGGRAAAVDASGTTPLTRDALQAVWRSRTSHNKTSQTWLSFPLANKTSNARIAKTVSKTALNSEMPKSLSIDDVMRLVDTEEGDILVLKEIMKRDDESSGILSLSLSNEDSLRTDSEITTTTSTSFAMHEYSKSKHHNSRNNSIFTNSIQPSQLFTTNFTPILSTFATLLEQQQQQPSQSLNYNENLKNLEKQKNCCALSQVIGLLPQRTLNDLELLEELEDRVLLSSSGSFEINPSVHFRSRLSLIPEQNSKIEGECSDFSSSTDESSAYSSSSTSSSFNNYNNPKQYLNVLALNDATAKIKTSKKNCTAESSDHIPSCSSKSSGISAIFGSLFGPNLGAGNPTTTSTTQTTTKQKQTTSNISPDISLIP